MIKRKENGGFTVLELLVTMALVGVVSGIAVSNIKLLDNPLTNSKAQVTHYLRLARARAISQTRSIKIAPVANNRLQGYTAQSCDSSTFTALDDLELDMEDNAQFDTTDWSVCFNQRGLASEHTVFGFTTVGGSKTVQVALGGGVKIE